MKLYSEYRIHYFCWIMLILIISGCSGERKVYEKYHEFDDMSWNRFDYLTFEAALDDVNASYDIYIAIRHIPEIPYKEMEVNLTIHSPSGVMRSANHVMDLVDREGNRLSECLGDLCDIEILIHEGYTINNPGTVKFEIENKHTKLEMPGIMKVGMVVRKSGKS